VQRVSEAATASSTGRLLVEGGRTNIRQKGCTNGLQRSWSSVQFKCLVRLLVKALGVAAVVSDEFASRAPLASRVALSLRRFTHKLLVLKNLCLQHAFAEVAASSVQRYNPFHCQCAPSRQHRMLQLSHYPHEKPAVPVCSSILLSCLSSGDPICLLPAACRWCLSRRISSRKPTTAPKCTHTSTHTQRLTERCPRT
jgi:hypothetical protein